MKMFENNWGLLLVGAISSYVGDSKNNLKIDRKG